jgi:DNA-binding transcriptional LysR family regulator
MLNVHRMRVLREVARCGSIAGAADALALTPSAASQHVSMLERETGVALLERGPCSIRLTEAGRVLAAHADDVLVRLASAEASLRAVAALTDGTLAVASFATAGPALLAPALAELRLRRGVVAVSHVQADPEAALPMLAAGEVDLALVYRYDSAADPPPGMTLAPLCDDPVLVALPRGHRLAAGTAVAPEDRAGEAWIAGGETASCRPVGVAPRIAVRTDDHALACCLVAGGAGVALVPRMAVRAMPHGVALRPLAGEGLSRRVFAAHRTAAERAPAVAAVLEALRSVS